MAERDGSEGYAGQNFLGGKWCQRMGFVRHQRKCCCIFNIFLSSWYILNRYYEDYDNYPSLKQIFDGVMIEANE